MNPYSILEIKGHGTDEEIRLAYLEKVRDFSPDKFPEQFKMIHQAYEKINSKEKRCRYFLDINTMENNSIKSILLDYIKLDTSRKPLSAEEFQKLIEETSLL